MAKKPAVKFQETVQVKDWGTPSINRLAIVLEALAQMESREEVGYLRISEG